MRFLIVGAGALGGFLAARLALAGHAVDLVARGAHLDAIRRRGLTLVEAGRDSQTVAVGAHAQVTDAPPSDVVLVTLKSHQLPAMAAPLAAAAARASLLVPLQNGVGWWYFLGTPAGRWAGRTVAAVDPDGMLAATLPLDRIAPMFAFKSTEVVAPGVVSHIRSDADDFPCGRVDGRGGAALDSLVAAMTSAGLRCRAADVRTLMWTKLLGNTFANPICALTGLPLGPAVSHPDGRALALALMAECAAVAAAHGVLLPVETFDQRLARAASLHRARPSMLQDRDAGRPMELDAILGALVEMGRLADVDTPRVQALLACLRLIETRAGATRAPFPNHPPP